MANRRSVSVTLPMPERGEHVHVMISVDFRERRGYYLTAQQVKIENGMMSFMLFADTHANALIAKSDRFNSKTFEGFAALVASRKAEARPMLAVGNWKGAADFLATGVRPVLVVVEADPFEVLMRAVADRLVVAGETGATIEHMGGNIWCVIIPRGEGQFIAGVSNETWGADFYASQQAMEEGEPHGYGVTTDVPVTSTDHDAIAAALLDGINVFYARGGVR